MFTPTNRNGLPSIMNDVPCAVTNELSSALSKVYVGWGTGCGAFSPQPAVSSRTEASTTSATKRRNNLLIIKTYAYLPIDRRRPSLLLPFRCHRRPPVQDEVQNGRRCTAPPGFRFGR